jgi:hypothetical protein
MTHSVTPRKVIAALGGPSRASELIFGDAKKQNVVSNWLHASRNRIPAEARIMDVIEARTPYTRYQVRPDVYGPPPRKSA